MPWTTREVSLGSFPIKRLSGVSPDVMQAAAGRWKKRLRLDPPLELLVQPLDRRTMHGA